MNLRSLVLLTLCAGWLGAMEPDVERALHEKTLRDAGAATDPASLLKLFRDRVPSEEIKTQLARTVRELGARSYVARNAAEQELIKVGRLALPVLRPALKDRDLEIVRRAERCVAAIEENDDAPLLTAAARLLAVRKNADAVAPLLAYLPGAGDEYVVECIHHALAECGMREGNIDAQLLAALSDREPSKRLASAWVVGQAGVRQRLGLRPLLADGDAGVRMQAAIGLLRIGDRVAAATLLQMMRDAPLPLATQAEEVFNQIAGDKAPPVALGQDELVRRHCVGEWEKWWKSNNANLDWKQLTVEPPTQGLTLICEAHLPNGGRVFECGKDGKVRWSIKCNNPIDAQMVAGNRVLIADCHAGKVIELDRDGKEHWVYTCVSPVCVQRLPGGNTFIMTHTDIMEVKRDGSKVYSFPRGGYLYYAQKLRDGAIVVISSDGVLAEVDTTGKEKWKLTLGGTGNWGGVEALSSGRYLVAHSGANEVVEVDRSGKVLWRVGATNPNSATRLKNGNTLVSSHDEKTVYEYDRAGKVVWRRALEGSTFRSRRR